MAFSILRQSYRCLAGSAGSYRRLETAVPGLIVYHDFLGVDLQKTLQEKAVELSRKILGNLESASTHPRRTYVSQYHNLDKEGHYRLIRIEDEKGKDVQGQYFENYGDKGHKLTYFIGNNNVLKFVQNELLFRIMQIPEISALSALSPLNWKFTFNTYAMTEDPSQLSGFDWHQDVAPNGDITMIYSIGAESQFQIRRPKQPATTLTVPLVSDSLVILSREARWLDEHRVVPVKVGAGQPLLDREGEVIRRISLVLGCVRSDKISDQSKYR